MLGITTTTKSTWKLVRDNSSNNTLFVCPHSKDTAFLQSLLLSI